MSKDNIFIKKLKKQFLSVNDSIESYFSEIKPLFLKIKKNKFDPSNKAFLVLGFFLILILTYFSVPAFYDKNIIKSKIESHFFQNFNAELEFEEKINFNLFPKPHFVSKRLNILSDKNEIAKIKNAKIYISNNNFFLFNDVKIGNIIFDKSEFNLTNKDINIFKKFLFTDPSKNILKIKKSKIFYKSLDGDVLFICKILDGKFFYNFQNLENILLSKNEIFNLPFTLEIKNNYFEDRISTKLISKKLRINVENELNYKDKIKKGLVKFSLKNNDISIDYKFDQKSLNFESVRKNFFNGNIDLKPFYASSNINYENANLKNLLNNDSILVELIQSEIFFNENLNGNINLKINKITNLDQLNRLFLKIGFAEGNIDLSDSSIMWRDDLKIEFKDTLLNLNNNEIDIIGKLDFNFKNIENLYSFFQIKKKFRKKIQKVSIDFVYNLNKKEFTFDNPQIDNYSNQDLQSLINNFNKKETRSFNKITFKKFINNFFNAYAG